MKYEKMIQSILKEVGGQENIENVYHCATRLRFQLKDETKANDEAVKAIDGVLSIVKGGGQYQIVIGQHVADVYNELQTMMGTCLLYTSPSPRDGLLSRMPSSA